MAEYKKRYRDEKGRFLPTRMIENIRMFYRQNFTEDERRKINLYDQIRKMDKITRQQTASQGAGLFVTDPIMYVGYSETPTSQINVTQKLSVAKKMNTTLLYKGERVTQSKFEDLVRLSIEESKIEHLLENESYYRTYVFLVDDVDNNTLNFDPNKVPNKSH